MSNRKVTVAFGVLVIGVAVYFLIVFSRPTPLSGEIDEIVSRNQSYDGEYVEQFVALGDAAVPALGQKLNSNVEFPMIYLLALEQIGAEEGGDYILEFVANQSPYSDVDRSYLTAIAIRALRRTGTKKSVDMIVDIMRDDKNQPRVRLASAATVSALGKPKQRDEAESYIQQVYTAWRGPASNSSVTLGEQEIYEAIGEVDSPWAIDVLLGALEGEVPSHRAVPIIDSLEKFGGEMIGDTLVGMIERRDMLELPTRLRAAEALVKIKGTTDVLPQEFAVNIHQEAITNAWPEEFRERAARLIVQ